MNKITYRYKFENHSQIVVYVNGKEVGYYYATFGKYSYISNISKIYSFNCKSNKELKSILNNIDWNIT